jgi:hypothetical protein
MRPHPAFPAPSVAQPAEISDFPVRWSPGAGVDGSVGNLGKSGYPHHILHKYQAGTARTWP